MRTGSPALLLRSAATAALAAVMIFAAGCPQQPSSGDGQTENGGSDASPEDRGTPASATAEVLKVTARVKELGGEVVYSDGRIVGIDLAKGRMSASDEDIALIAKIDDLFEFRAAGNAITDVSCKLLAGFENLESISLENTQVTNAGLQQLGQLKKVHTLRLRRNPRLTDEALSQLPHWKELDTVALIESEFTDAAIDPLIRCPKLRDVDFRGTVGITGAGLAKLHQLKIRAIRLGGPTIDNHAAAHVSRLPQLYILSIEDAAITDAAIGYFPKNITNLSLFRCYGLTDDGLKRLATQCPFLVQLSLRDTPITGEGLAAIADLSLVDLNLSETLLDGQSIAPLASVVGMTRLRLRQTPIGDEGCKTIARFAALRTLDASGTGISDTGVELLATLSILNSLDVSDNPLVTDAAAGSLARLKALQRLDLTGTSMTDVAIGNLEKRLPDCTIVR